MVAARRLRGPLSAPPVDDSPLPVLAPTADTLVIRAHRLLVVSFLLFGLGAGALLALTVARSPAEEVAKPGVWVYALFALYMVLQGLRMALVPLVRAGPDGFRMRLTMLQPGLRCLLGDLVAIARAPGGRPRLVVRVDGRERLYSLPIRTVSRADARRLVEWLHAHVAEPGTRVLGARHAEWTRGDPPHLS